MASFTFGEFPTLSTSRLALVELGPALARDVFAFRSDPIVQLYNSIPHQSLDDTLRFIAEQREKYVSHSEVIWGLWSHDLGRVVGSVSIYDWELYHRRAQIGYDLAVECWGQGLAQEAIRAVLEFAFVEMDLNRVEIWTSIANERSLKLAHRLGFQLDGTLRKRILEDDGTFHGCAVFGLLRSEWETIQGDSNPSKH